MFSRTILLRRTTLAARIAFFNKKKAEKKAESLSRRQSFAIKKALAEVKEKLASGASLEQIAKKLKKENPNASAAAATTTPTAKRSPPPPPTSPAEKAALLASRKATLEKLHSQHSGHLPQKAVAEAWGISDLKGMRDYLKRNNLSLQKVVDHQEKHKKLAAQLASRKQIFEKLSAKYAKKGGIPREVLTKAWGSDKFNRIKQYFYAHGFPTDKLQKLNLGRRQNTSLLSSRRESFNKLLKEHKKTGIPQAALVEAWGAKNFAEIRAYLYHNNFETNKVMRAAPVARAATSQTAQLLASRKASFNKLAEQYEKKKEGAGGGIPLKTALAKEWGLKPKGVMEYARLHKFPLEKIVQ